MEGRWISLAKHDKSYNENSSAIELWNYLIADQKKHGKDWQSKMIAKLFACSTDMECPPSAKKWSLGAMEPLFL